MCSARTAPYSVRRVSWSAAGEGIINQESQCVSQRSRSTPSAPNARRCLAWKSTAPAGIERFTIEFFRAKDDRLLSGFTIAQAMSVGLIAVGLYVVTRLRAPPAVIFAGTPKGTEG